MNKRNLKIIGLYIISLVCIVLYFLMKNYNFIFKIVERTNEFRDKGAVTFILAGLLQYGLLVVGICIFIILSYLLIKEKISKGQKN